MNIFDFTIIGSGPCGLLSAELFSKKGKTIVIEQGKYINEQESSLYSYDHISEAYYNGGFNLAYGLPPVILSEAKCVGGGSAVNSSIHHRAPKEIWNKWRELYHLKGFEEDLLEYVYNDIENIFDAKKGDINPSIFYKKAEIIIKQKLLI